MSALARLRTIEKAAAWLQEADDAEVQLVGAVVRTWLAARLIGNPHSFEAAFGLAGTRGRDSAFSARRRQERDEALAALAASFGSEIASPDSEGIWDTHEALRDFPWLRYRDLQECPERLLGRREELIWRVLKLSGGRVLSRKQIAAILSRN